MQGNSRGRRAQPLLLRVNQGKRSIIFLMVGDQTVEPTQAVRVVKKDFNLVGSGGSLVMLVCCMLFSMPSTAQVVFDFADLSKWQRKHFVGETSYQAKQENGVRYIQAIANASASGFYREREVSIDADSTIAWRWRTAKLAQGNDELTKAGDDYPLRISVVVSTGFGFWNLRTINYIWSNSQPVGTLFASPYSAKAQFIVVASGPEGLGEWQYYERDIQADFNQAFGIKPKQIDAIALMTDGDNSQQNFVGDYGEPVIR